MADDVAVYEKLRAFYLVWPVDPALSVAEPTTLLYDLRR
jgi:hypothetical protein